MAGDLRRTCGVLGLGAGLLLALLLASSQDVQATSGQSSGRQHPVLFNQPPLLRVTPSQPYDQGLPTYGMAVSVAVAPVGEGVIYVSTYEPPGIWRSEDGARTWEPDDRGLQGRPVYTLHWDAVRSCWWAAACGGIYARSAAEATWRAAGLSERAVYAVAEAVAGDLYAATDDGLYQSADGVTWQAVPLGGAQAPVVILDVAVSADGHALMIGTAGQGVWASLDGGAAWSQGVASGDAEDQGLAQACVSALLLDQRSGGAAYAGASDRAYRSADGGLSWQPLAGLDGRVHAFAIGGDASLYAALAGQVARSTDGGSTWTLDGAGLRRDDKVLGLAGDAGAPALVYAAAWEGLYVSSDSGRTWLRRSQGLGYPDVNVLAWDASGSLLAGTRSGLWRRDAAQAAWEAVPSLQGRPVLTVVQAGDGGAFYAGCSGGLFRSADGGRSWTEVSSTLSTAGIAGLVVEPDDPQHVRAWVAYGRVHESTDGGRTWNARWAGLGDVRPVSAIHRSSAGQVYVGAEDGMFIWDAAGQLWAPLALPLAAPSVFAIETDAGDPQAVYAGSTDGLWRSSDGGESWGRWGQGLDGKSVTAVAFSPTDRRIAVAGTRHMGLYVTDDSGATWAPAAVGGLGSFSVRSMVFSPDGALLYIASDQGIQRSEVHAGP